MTTSIQVIPIDGEVVIPTPDELKETARKLFEGIEKLEIATQDEYEAAGETLKAVKAGQKKTEAARVAAGAPALEEKRRIDQAYSEPAALWTRAETVLKTAILGYTKAQEQRRIELQKKQDQDRRAIVLEATKTAEIAVQTGDADLRETSEDLWREAAVRTGPVKTIAPVKGLSVRTTWSGVIENVDLVPVETLRAWAIHPDIRPAIEAHLSRLAKAVKGPSGIPGVSYSSDQSLAAGSK